jgi:aminoglycoside phosphotransferase (APT) family kinase protein
MLSDSDLSTRLQAALTRHMGRPVALRDLQRLTAGANRTTASFDVDVGEERRELIVQLGSMAADPGAGIVPEATIEQQAHLMIAAKRANVPAPHVVAILNPSDGLGEGYIAERVAGETLGPRIVREERFARARQVMARQCGEILAAIHQIAIEQVPFLICQEAAEHVAAHRRLVDYYHFKLPALDLALRWAAENAPRAKRHTVVHGDFRTGNLVVSEESIRCVLDWELAQTGDPMQDLGWLCIRTWRFGGAKPVGGFGSREDLFSSYERAGGDAVDPARVKFWEAFGNVKWAIDCLRLGMRGVGEGSVELSAVGRRIEEPLWDFFDLIESRE